MPTFFTEVPPSNDAYPLPMTTVFNSENLPIREVRRELCLRVQTAPLCASKQEGSKRCFESRQFRSRAEEHIEEPLKRASSASTYDFKTDRLNESMRLEPLARRGRPPFFRLEAVETAADNDPRWCALARQQFGEGPVSIESERQSSLAVTRLKLREQQSITSEVVKQRFEQDLSYIRYKFRK